MKIISSVFDNNQPIPAKFTCSGLNINPPLEFYDTPVHTQSLALIVEDPDAPQVNFTHWVLFNLPASTTSLAQNSIPDSSVEGVNDAGLIGYYGPCPPSGVHRYNFTLYALDTSLSLSTGVAKENVQKAMENHIIEAAVLVGTYSK